MRSSSLNLRFAGALAIGSLILVAAGSAMAEPAYPRKIKSTLQLNYEPPCSVCHQYGKTGDGTPIEPFAWSMRQRGLSADNSSFAPALASDESDRVDSDGDGVPDTVELQVGTDPNSVANDCIIPSGTVTTSSQCDPDIQASPGLGCGVVVSRRDPPEGFGRIAIFGCMAGLTVWGRRRGPRPSRRD
jgi:hypothetical protein